LPVPGYFANSRRRLNHEAGGRSDEETAFHSFCAVNAGHRHSGGCGKLSAWEALVLLRLEVRLRLRENLEKVAAVGGLFHLSAWPPPVRESNGRNI